MIAGEGHAVRSTGSRAAWALSLFLAVGCALAFLVANHSYGYDIAGGLVVGAVVTVLGLVMLPRIVASEPDPRVRRIVAASYWLKILSALAIYGVTFGIYGGGDAGLYHRSGVVYAEQIWDGVLLPDAAGSLVGTAFMEVIVGWVYAAISPTRLGGFLVFALLGWAGLFLFYRAFCLAVADGNRRWYAALLLLLPSLLFWPSTIGKESWMMLTLGVASYGVARWFCQRRGIPLIGLGLLGMSLIRPHMAVFVFAALTGAVLLASGREAKGASMGSRAMMLLLLVAVAPLIASQTEEFLNVESASIEAVDQVMERVSGTTTTGGSSFSNSLVQGPLDVPIAFFSVLMRPFPWEAGGVLQLLSSLEGVALAVILWKRRGALRRLPRVMRRQPYVAYAAVYAVLFVIGFSSFNNLGLLARERTQVFPFLLVCICVAATSTVRENEPTTVRTPGRARPVVVR